MTIASSPPYKLGENFIMADGKVTTLSQAPQDTSMGAQRQFLLSSGGHVVVKPNPDIGRLSKKRKLESLVAKMKTDACNRVMEQSLKDMAEVDLTADKPVVASPGPTSLLRNCEHSSHKKPRIKTPDFTPVEISLPGGTSKVLIGGLLGSKQDGQHDTVLKGQGGNMKSLLSPKLKSRRSECFTKAGLASFVKPKHKAKPAVPSMPSTVSAVELSSSTESCVIRNQARDAVSKPTPIVEPNLKSRSNKVSLLTPRAGATSLLKLNPEELRLPTTISLSTVISSTNSESSVISTSQSLMPSTSVIDSSIPQPLAPTSNQRSDSLLGMRQNCDSPGSFSNNTSVYLGLDCESSCLVYSNGTSQCGPSGPGAKSHSAERSHSEAADTVSYLAKVGSRSLLSPQYRTASYPQQQNPTSASSGLSGALTKTVASSNTKIKSVIPTTSDVGLIPVASNPEHSSMSSSSPKSADKTSGRISLEPSRSLLQRTLSGGGILSQNDKNTIAEKQPSYVSLLNQSPDTVKTVSRRLSLLKQTSRPNCSSSPDQVACSGSSQSTGQHAGSSASSPIEMPKSKPESTCVSPLSVGVTSERYQTFIADSGQVSIKRQSSTNLESPDLQNLLTSPVCELPVTSFGNNTLHLTSQSDITAEPHGKRQSQAAASNAIQNVNLHAQIPYKQSIPKLKNSTKSVADVPEITDPGSPAYGHHASVGTSSMPLLRQLQSLDFSNDADKIFNKFGSSKKTSIKDLYGFHRGSIMNLSTRVTDNIDKHKSGSSVPVIHTVLEESKDCVLDLSSKGSASSPVIIQPHRLDMGQSVTVKDVCHVISNDVDDSDSSEHAMDLSTKTQPGNCSGLNSYNQSILRRTSSNGHDHIKATSVTNTCRKRASQKDCRESLELKTSKSAPQSSEIGQHIDELISDNQALLNEPGLLVYSRASHVEENNRINSHVSVSGGTMHTMATTDCQDSSSNTIHITLDNISLLNNLARELHPLKQDNPVKKAEMSKVPKSEIKGGNSLSPAKKNVVLMQASPKKNAVLMQASPKKNVVLMQACPKKNVVLMQSLISGKVFSDLSWRYNEATVTSNMDTCEDNPSSPVASSSNSMEAAGDGQDHKEDGEATESQEKATHQSRSGAKDTKSVGSLKQDSNYSDDGISDAMNSIETYTYERNDSSRITKGVDTSPSMEDPMPKSDAQVTPVSIVPICENTAKDNLERGNGEESDRNLSSVHIENNHICLLPGSDQLDVPCTDAQLDVPSRSPGEACLPASHDQGDQFSHLDVSDGATSWTSTRTGTPSLKLESPFYTDVEITRSRRCTKPYQFDEIENPTPTSINSHPMSVEVTNKNVSSQEYEPEDENSNSGVQNDIVILGVHPDIMNAKIVKIEKLPSGVSDTKCMGIKRHNSCDNDSDRTKPVTQNMNRKSSTAKSEPDTEGYTGSIVQRIKTEYCPSHGAENNELTTKGFDENLNSVKVEKVSEDAGPCDDDEDTKEENSVHQSVTAAIGGYPVIGSIQLIGSISVSQVSPTSDAEKACGSPPSNTSRGADNAAPSGSVASCVNDGIRKVEYQSDQVQSDSPSLAPSVSQDEKKNMSLMAITDDSRTPTRCPMHGTTAQQCVRKAGPVVHCTKRKDMLNVITIGGSCPSPDPYALTKNILSGNKSAAYNNDKTTDMDTSPHSPRNEPDQSGLKATHSETATIESLPVSDVEDSNNHQDASRDICTASELDTKCNTASNLKDHSCNINESSKSHNQQKGESPGSEGNKECVVKNRGPEPNYVIEIAPQPMWGAKQPNAVRLRSLLTGKIVGPKTEIKNREDSQLATTTPKTSSTSHPTKTLMIIREIHRVKRAKHLERSKQLNGASQGDSAACGKNDTEKGSLPQSPAPSASANTKTEEVSPELLEQGSLAAALWRELSQTKTEDDVISLPDLNPQSLMSLTDCDLDFDLTGGFTPPYFHPYPDWNNEVIDLDLEDPLGLDWKPLLPFADELFSLPSTPNSKVPNIGVDRNSTNMTDTTATTSSPCLSMASANRRKSCTKTVESNGRVKKCSRKSTPYKIQPQDRDMFLDLTGDTCRSTVPSTLPFNPSVKRSTLNMCGGDMICNTVSSGGSTATSGGWSTLNSSLPGMSTGVYSQCADASKDVMVVHQPEFIDLSELKGIKKL